MLLKDKNTIFQENPHFIRRTVVSEERRKATLERIKEYFGKRKEASKNCIICLLTNTN